MIFFKNTSQGINAPNFNIRVLFFQKFATPETVPPVPTPTTRWVIFPSVCSQSQVPVVR
jgi:hypothetical protein